jgi:hypothetical protein
VGAYNRTYLGVAIEIKGFIVFTMPTFDGLCKGK